MSSNTKTVLITGAAGGIGRAMVKTFKESGYFVIATDCVSDPSGLYSDKYIQLDLELFASCENTAKIAIADIAASFPSGQFDVLINNAAIQVLENTISLSRQDWKKTLDVNLLAPFFLTQSLLPHFSQDNAKIINISSIHAHLTKPAFVAYSTSKAALSGLTRALAVDLGERATIIGIEPAAIETEMLVAGLRSNEYLQKLKNYHPSGCIGNPVDFASMVLMLADHSSRFITGMIVSYSGGISSRLHDPE